ncbi:MAG: hypothetical protein SF029_01200 [bacterium]|nr:hypothetical protein [bacterium]
MRSWHTKMWHGAIWRGTLVLGLVVGLTTLLAMVVGAMQPDSGKLAFWSLHPQGYGLYVMDPYRLLEMRLMAPPPFLVVDLPRLSDDGQRVAFETVHEGRLRVFVKDIHGRVLYQTEPGIEDRLPVLSPDGGQVGLWSAPHTPRTVARFQNWSFYIIDIASAQARQITAQLAMLPSDRPLWSPDGRRIAVRFWRAGSDEGVFIVDVATGEIRDVPGDVDPSSDLVWSPDGEQIAFRSARDLNPEVYVLNIHDGSLRNLSHHPASDFQPAWSPRAGEFAFVSTRGGGGNLYLMDTASGIIQQLTTQGGRQPYWSPTGSHVAFTAAQNNRDGLYVVSRDGSGLRLITPLTEHKLFLGWFPVSAPRASR